MRIAVIIPAAGSSKRFNGAEGASASGGNKIELDLAGRPVFLRSIELFLNRPIVGQIILAVNPGMVEDFKFRWGDKLLFHGVELVPGGRVERWETVSKALATVNSDCTHVAIHDAARPLATPQLIDRVFEAAALYPAVIPGVAVSATLKRVEPEKVERAQDPLDAILGSAGKPVLDVKRVVQTVDRSSLVEIQTPQVFEIGLLRRAYANEAALPGVTDDASLIEALNDAATPVRVVEGEAANLKITRPADMEIALAIVEKREQKTAAVMARKRLFADEEE